MLILIDSLALLRWLLNVLPDHNFLSNSPHLLFSFPINSPKVHFLVLTMCISNTRTWTPGGTYKNIRESFYKTLTILDHSWLRNDRLLMKLLHMLIGWKYRKIKERKWESRERSRRKLLSLALKRLLIQASYTFGLTSHSFSLYSLNASWAKLLPRTLIGSAISYSCSLGFPI